MRTFGRGFAEQLKSGDWIAIDGPLGAGKTTLCKGILKGLGFEGEVASPSYAIVHQYDPPETSVAVAHADLYRLENVAELDELGLDDGRDCRITLVEWAERAGSKLGMPTHQITITPQPDGSRLLTLNMDKHDIGI